MANDPAARRPHALSPNPRRQALEVISQALNPHGHGFAQELFEERFTHGSMKPEDRRLAAELAYGVIRRLGTLDAVLQAYSARPLDDLDAAVRQALRLGLYQMLFLERVPVHAAVDESVSLARATGNARATGFVNGVLRSIGRDLAFTEAADPARPRHSLELRPGRAVTFSKPVLPSPADSAGYLAALHSFPRPLVARWLAQHGATTTRELCAVANEPAPLFIRPNALRVTAEQLLGRLKEDGIEAQPSPSGRTLRLPPGTHVPELKSFQEGLFLVQDDSSAAVAPFLDPQPGERVADLAAAPGGKTCHLGELMRNEGALSAVDSSAKRLERVVENMRRLDVRIITPVEADAAVFAGQRAGQFDRALLDAPCSNTGVLRRRVEARWRFSESALAAIVRQQRLLLDAALRCLKPGGTLVYSTCSLEPEENDQLVAAVLRAAPGYRLDAQQPLLPSREGGDGMFMARIVRMDG